MPTPAFAAVRRSDTIDRYTGQIDNLLSPCEQQRDDQRCWAVGKINRTDNVLDQRSRGGDGLFKLGFVVGSPA